MKVDRGQEPLRWQETSEIESETEAVAELAACIRAAHARSDWNGHRINRIWEQLHRRVNGNDVTKRVVPRWRAPTWAMVIGGVLLGGAATVVAGMVVGTRSHRQARPDAKLSRTPVASPIQMKARGSWQEHAPRDERSSAAPPTVLPEPISREGVNGDIAVAREGGRLPAGASAGGSAPRQRPERAMSRRLAHSLDSDPRALDPGRGEGTSLAAAMRALHADGDPARALRMLDEYELRYPTGALHGEAILLRAETLLASGRQQEALQVLGAVTIGPEHFSRRVALTRAQLRSATGDCREALADFSSAMSGGDDRPDAIDARALYGRAVCRLNVGDISGAGADLRTYLSRHPGASQRGDVERMLLRLR